MQEYHLVETEPAALGHDDRSVFDPQDVALTKCDDSFCIIPIKNGLLALIERIACLLGILEDAHTRGGGSAEINLVCSGRYFFTNGIVSLRNSGSSWSRITVAAFRHISNPSNCCAVLSEAQVFTGIQADPRFTITHEVPLHSGHVTKP